MSDLKALAETMKSWSDTAGDHHWQAGCALEQMVGLQAQIELVTLQRDVLALNRDPRDSQVLIVMDGEVVAGVIWPETQTATQTPVKMPTGVRRPSVAHIEAAAVARAVLVLAADRLEKGIVDVPRCEIEGAVLRALRLEMDDFDPADSPAFTAGQIKCISILGRLLERDA
jgi:hypothetical protein